MQSMIDEGNLSFNSNMQNSTSSKSTFDEIISNFPSMKNRLNIDKAFFNRFAELFQTNTSLQSNSSSLLTFIKNFISRSTVIYDESKEYITDTFIYFLMKTAISESNNILIHDLDHIIKMNKLEERIQGKSIKKDIYSYYNSNEIKFIQILEGSSWIWIYHLHKQLRKILLNIIFSYFHDDLFYDKLNILKSISKIIAFIFTFPNIHVSTDDSNNSDSPLDHIDYNNHHSFILTILKLSQRYGMLLLNVPWIIDYLTILKHDQSIMKSDFIKKILYELKIIHKKLKQEMNGSVNEPSFINYLFLTSTIEPIFKEFSYDIQHDMPSISINDDENNDIIEGFKLSVSSHHIDTSIKLKLNDDINFMKILKDQMESSPLSSNKEEVSIRHIKPKKITPIVVKKELNDHSINPNIQYFVNSVLSIGHEFSHRIIKKELISLISKHSKNGTIEYHDLLKLIHEDIVDRSMAYCEEKLIGLFNVMMPNINNETLSIYMDNAKRNLKYSLSDIIMKSLSNENMIINEQKKMNDLSVILMNDIDDIEIERLFQLPIFNSPKKYKLRSVYTYMVSLHFLLSYAPYKINENEIRAFEIIEDTSQLSKDEIYKNKLLEYCHQLYKCNKTDIHQFNRMIDVIFQRYEPFEKTFFAKMLMSKCVCNDCYIIYYCLFI